MAPISESVFRARKSQQHFQHSRVWHCATEDLHMLYLPGHDRLFHAFVFKEANHPTKLTNANPLHTFGQFFDFRISFFADRRNGHLDARLTCTLQDHEGKLAIAGNQSEFHLVTPRLELR